MEENNLQQPMEQEIWVPQTRPPKTKKSKWPVIAIIAAAVLTVLAVTAVLLYKFVWDTPQARLTRGLAKLGAELSEGANPIVQEINYETIAEKMYTEPYSMTAGLNITMPELEEIGTIGMDMAMDYDYPGRKLQGDMLFSVYNIHLLEAEYTAADDRFYVSLPNLAKGVYAVNTQTFGADYHSSVWADMLEMEVDRDMVLELFPEREGKEPVFDEALQELFAENIQSLSKTMVIEDTGDTIEISRDGNLVTCKGVRVVLHKVALNQFMKALMKEMDERSLLDNEVSLTFAENLEICIYMDKHDRIVCVKTPKKVIFQGSDMEAADLTLMLTGTERTTDEMELCLQVEAAGTVMDITVSDSSTLTKELYKNKLKLTFATNETDEAAELVYVQEWALPDKQLKINMLLTADGIYQMEAKGSFSDIVTGESFSFALDNMSVQADGEKVLKITGTMALKPFTDTITAPQGAVDFFGMSEEEVNTLLEEFYSSILGWFM